MIFADHSSELRRNINQLHEGRFFIGLLSELDIMERSKKKNEVKFWANKTYALKYGNYLKTKQTAKELTDEIEAIEMNLALVCMDMKRYQTTVKEDIKIWETQYLT